jgi:hypothetical protein
LAVSDGMLAIEGRLRRVTLFGENLLLTRRIETWLRSTALTVTDIVTNEGFRHEPVLLLHHVNLGFPVLAATSELLLPPGTLSMPDDDGRWRTGAESGSAGGVCFHTLPPRADGMSTLALVNRAFDGGRGIGVQLRYSQGSFPLVWQWRNYREGEYVMGLEPTNVLGGGRKPTREEGALRILAPGETKTFRTENTALGDRVAIDAAARRIEGSAG